MNVKSRGFALPTVLIVGTVMMILLLTGISAIASISQSINNQYYSQIANEAAESGLNRVANCLLASKGVVTWSNSKPLKPNTDCSGNQTVTCATTNLGPCSVLYTSNLSTTFSVGLPTSSGQGLVVSSLGQTSVLASTTGVSTNQVTSSVNASFDSGLQSADFISSGYLEVCAIFDGETSCWGTNGHGVLGNGETSASVNSLAPVKMARLPGGLLGKTDKIVSVGYATTCIATTDNEIYCLGWNNYGQLGLGYYNAYSGASSSNQDVTVPTKVQMPASMIGKDITAIEGGAGFTCAIAGGDVYCWGYNVFGMIGDGTTTSSRNVPTQVATIGASNGKVVTDLSTDSSSYHVCAVALGKAYCWGYNGRGEAGDPSSTANKLSPFPVDTSSSSSLNGRTVKKIVASGRYPGTMVNDNQYPTNPTTPDLARGGHVCALDTGGWESCWGADQYGQTGAGTASPYNSNQSISYRRIYPTRVTAGGLSAKIITDISVGNVSSCALVSSENKVYCWGFNDRGQIGIHNYPIYTTQLTPTPITVTGTPLDGQTVSTVYGGENRHCVITTIKRVFCWGVNSSAGQIGDGTTIDRDQPTEAILLYQLGKFTYY